MKERRTGHILLEVQFVLFFLVLLAGTVYMHFQTLLRNGICVRSDLRLLQSARFSASLVKSELSEQGTRVLLKGSSGEDAGMTVGCRRSDGQTRISFYVQNGTLYRSIRKYKSQPGVVPNSDTHVRVQAWKLRRLSEDKAEILLTLEDRQTRHRRTFRRVLRTLNGCVEAVSPG